MFILLISFLLSVAASIPVFTDGAKPVGRIELSDNDGLLDLAWDADRKRTCALILVLAEPARIYYKEFAEDGKLGVSYALREEWRLESGLFKYDGKVSAIVWSSLEPEVLVDLGTVRPRAGAAIEDVSAFDRQFDDPVSREVRDLLLQAGWRSAPVPGQGLPNAELERERLRIHIPHLTDRVAWSPSGQQVAAGWSVLNSQFVIIEELRDSSVRRVKVEPVVKQNLRGGPFALDAVRIDKTHVSWGVRPLGGTLRDSQVVWCDLQKDGLVFKRAERGMLARKLHHLRAGGGL